MSSNNRLNKNVIANKFLNLIKEADDGGLLKSVEYVQLEQLISENLSKNNFLNKLVNKLITDSTSFTLEELDRFNLINSEEQLDNDLEDSDYRVEQLQQHLSLIKDQKELLECELMKLYNFELDDELSNEREQLNELRMKLTKLFDDLKPLLQTKKLTKQEKTRLDQQLINKLDKLKEKKIEINELIEEVLMHVDLSLNRDKLVRLIEREYCLKLIQIKNLLEWLKNEADLIVKIYRNKMIKNTIWKVYLKDLKDEITKEENLISCLDHTEERVKLNSDNKTNSKLDLFNFEEFKEFLNLAKSDPLDDLLLQVKTTFKKIKDN